MQRILGQGNPVTQAESFIAPDVKDKKQLPKNILDEASLNDMAMFEDQIRKDYYNRELGNDIQSAIQ